MDKESEKIMAENFQIFLKIKNNNNNIDLRSSAIAKKDKQNENHTITNHNRTAEIQWRNLKIFHRRKDIYRGTEIRMSEVFSSNSM